MNQPSRRLFLGLSALPVMSLAAACSTSEQESEPDIAILGPSDVRITTSSTVKESYRASGGKPPYEFRVVSGKVAGLELSKDGKLSGKPRFPGTFDLTIQAQDSTGAVSSPYPISISFVRSGPSADVMALGTSLTARLGVEQGGHTPWPTLWPRVTGYQSRNWGWPGHTSGEIARRFGALPYRTVEAVTIPARGSVLVPVDALTMKEQSPATFGGVKGTIIGEVVQGKSAAKVRFTRDEPGKPVDVPAGSKLLVTTDISPYRNMTLVIEASRNDSLSQRGAVDKTIANHVALIKHFTHGRDDDRYLVAGQPLATNDSEDSRALRRECNRRLAKEFGDRYVETWDFLLSDACAEFLKISWTADDKRDIRAGITPTSLRVDNLHPNSLAHRAIAHFYQGEFKKRGWL